VRFGGGSESRARGKEVKVKRREELGREENEIEQIRRG